MPQIHNAVSKALIAAIATAVAPVPVKGDTPPDQALPYVAVVDHREIPDGTLDADAWEITVTATVFSAVRGTREVSRIVDQIKAALHFADLVLDAGACIRCRIQRDDITKDPDGATYTGSVLIEVLVSDD